MKTNIYNARHHARVGPGGWFCACCGPAPKHRKKFVKLHQARINRMLDRMEQDLTR